MKYKVIEANRKTIETLQKANRLCNSAVLTPNERTKKVLTQEINGQVNANATLIPAKVKSGNGLVGYECDIFKNGLSEPATEVATVFLANGASSIYALPPGTVIYVSRFALPIHGGV